MLDAETSWGRRFRTTRQNDITAVNYVIVLNALFLILKLGLSFLSAKSPDTFPLAHVSVHRGLGLRRGWNLEDRQSTRPRPRHVMTSLYLQ